MMFGIVTSGLSWRFIQWNGTLESPKAEITQEYPGIFENDMKEAKKVVSYIVRVLQAQATHWAKRNHDDAM
ncbi:12889_t:CDS:1, partial [Gigaspora margarita]